jgi:hypothetical protein
LFNAGAVLWVKGGSPITCHVQFFLYRVCASALLVFPWSVALVTALDFFSWSLFRDQLTYSRSKKSD